MTTDHTSDIPLFPCALVAVLRAADSCRFGVTIAAAIDVGGDSCASAASVLLEPAVPIDGAGRRQRTRSSLTMQRAVRFRIIGSCERCTQQYFIGQQACRSGCERDAHIFSSRVGVTFCQGNAQPEEGLMMKSAEGAWWVVPIYARASDGLTGCLQQQPSAQAQMTLIRDSS